MILVSVAIIFVALLDLWVLDRVVNGREGEETLAKNSCSHDAPNEPQKISGSHDAPDEPQKAWSSPSRTIETTESSYGSPEVPTSSWQSPKRNVLGSDEDGEACTRSPSVISPSPPRRIILQELMEPSPLKQPLLLHQQPSTHQSTDRALEAAERLEDLLAVQAAATQLTRLYSQIILLNNKVSQLQQEAATKIHHCYRSHRRRRRQLIRLQSWCRMVLRREHYQKLLKSAILVQSLHREKIANRYATKQRHLIRKLQHSWRRYLLRKRHERQSFTESLIRIQALWRSLAARTLAANRQKGVLVIQATARRHLQWRRHQQIKAASIRIQALARQKIVQDHRHKYRKAAIRFQSLYRGYRARAISTAQRQSAKVIQRVARRHYRRHVEAVQLQSWFRMQTHRRQYTRTKTAVIRLQCLQRSIIARKVLVYRLLCVQLLQRVVLRREAATKLQSWYRLHTHCHKFALAKAAVTRIQCLQRCIVARNARSSKLRSVQVLQRFAQRYHQRREAAIKLQAWYRMQPHRRQYARTKAAVIRIQCWQRIIVARNVHTSRLHNSKVRQRKARRHHPWCAVVTKAHSSYPIQTHRQQYALTKAAAIRIQCWQRSLIARNHRASRLHSIQLLQQVVRRHILRRVAATKLQAWYRMQAHRPQYVMTRAAVIRMQGWQRRVVARNVRATRLRCVQVLQREARRHNRRRSAATKLQSWYRMEARRQQYAIIRKVAISVQKLFRGRAARDFTKKQQRRLVILQKPIKRYLNLKRESNVAATRVQQFTDNRRHGGFQACKPEVYDTHTLTVNASAKTIQSIVRMFLAKRYLAKLDHPLIMTGSLDGSRSSPSLIDSEESVCSPKPSPMLLRSRTPSPITRSPILSPLPWQDHGESHLVGDEKEGQDEVLVLAMTPKRQNGRNEPVATEIMDDRRSHVEANIERQAQLAVLRTFGEISARRHRAASMLQRAFRREKRSPPENALRETSASESSCLCRFMDCINFLSCTSSRAVQDIPSTARRYNDPRIPNE